MADLAPQSAPFKPNAKRIALAFAVAIASDLFSFFTSGLVIAAPIVLAVDIATGLALWAALGAPGVLLAALVAEAIPGVGVIPLWTLVVAALAFKGTLSGRRSTLPSKPPAQSP